MNITEGWKEKYGIANLCIVLICTLSLIINAFTVSQEELWLLNENKGFAFILNFLLADKGILISNGSMSYNAVFHDRQYWRIITNIYICMPDFFIWHLTWWHLFV